MWRLLILILFSLPAIASAEAVSGKVVGVTDGDTITVLINGRPQHVRLSDIDAPESRQAFGQRAKQSLSDLVFGKDVQLTITDRDRYGRLVARVRQGSTDVNLEQVNRGMAWAYRKYTHDEAVIMAESRARVRASGLWSEDDQTPPWEWRAGQKGAGSSSSHTTPKTESAAPTASSGARSLDGFFPDRDLDRFHAGASSAGSGGVYGGGSQDIHVGPRGGRYVVTEGGNKHYVGKGK
jgi:endonuclease YncB( thermonuclease family)